MFDLTKLACVLTGDAQVEVVVSDEGPRVDAHRLVVPSCDDEDLLVAYVDLLAARVAHGDAQAFGDVSAPVERKLAQIIDDRRACERLLATYPGARRYIERWRGRRLPTWHADGTISRGATS